MRSLTALALVALFSCCIDASLADAGKTKKLKNTLLSVPEPHAGQPANAHPFVNAIVLFGRLTDGTPADPATFRAKFGREDITGSFVPTYDDHGLQTGMRAKLEANKVKLGRRPRNALRLSVLAVRLGKKSPRIRDVDRVRFGAVEGQNKVCTAQADADTEVIVPGVPVQFTGSQGTSDPDKDELTYSWAFGDGTTSSDPDPQHTYGDSVGSVSAVLTVSDGQSSCTGNVELQAIPALDPGKTPGMLFVASDDALEFAAVAVGAAATKTITFRNTDQTETSQVKLRVGTTDGVFQLSEGAVSLGPGEEHQVTLTFAPNAEGHRNARVSIVANDSNRETVSLLAHGYGGSSPGTGPTYAADPVFYTAIAQLIGLGTYGIMPDGRNFFADNTVHTCLVPGNGLGTGDFCLTDQDCAVNGGTCTQSSTCLGGANGGQPCSVPSDCPGSYCPSYSLFDPVDLCSDGKSLFLISDEGTFSEPDPNAETERSVTLMRMDLAADGSVTHRELLGRTTEETSHIACDGFPANQGGQLYMPEFHNVPDQGSCFRSEREALLRVAKSNGSTQVITSRTDAYAGLGDCDDLDPVNQLEVARDGGRMLAGFESSGLWQIRPSTLFYSADITELFQLHPDGSVMYAAGADSGSTGLVNLYRITPGEVQHGPLPYSALVPCTSFAVPNNTLHDALGRTVVISLAAERNAVGSDDATALVSFVAASSSSPAVPSLLQMITPNLIVHGTVAFSAPANSSACNVIGLVRLGTSDSLELAF
jgi:hypothetical protein